MGDVPVTIDAWFLVAPLYAASAIGLRRAGVVAFVATMGFTVVHVVAHALLARSFGARPAARLDLLRGGSAREAASLTRPQRVAVSLVGPVAALVVGVAMQAIIRFEFERRARAGDFQGAFLMADVWFGVSWAGVVLALVTLVPLWPLAGGHLVAGLAGYRRSFTRVLAALSVLVAGGLVVLNRQLDRSGGPSWARSEVERAARALAVAFTQSFPRGVVMEVRAVPGLLLVAPWLLLLYCAVAGWQALDDQGVVVAPVPASDAEWIRVPPRPRGQPERRQVERTGNDRAFAAERAGWDNGRLVSFPPGWQASPWLRAHHSVGAGRPDVARATLATLTDAGGLRWNPPDPDRPELAELLPLLPSPPPVGALMRSRSLCAVLAHHGTPHEIVDYAQRLYEQHRDVDALYLAAEGLARAGLGDDAMAWLRRAVAEQPNADRLARERGFAPLHDRLDFQQLLASVRAAP